MRQLLVTAGLLLPLGLDTFVLAAALGMAGLESRGRLRVALVFTVFEAGMPIVGILAGRVIGGVLGDWADWVGIALVTAAGLLFLRSRRAEHDEGRDLRLLARARGVTIVYLGLSISLDELTVGLSAGLLGLSIAVTVVWVAIQAFIATQLGMRLGAMLSESLRERSERLTGVALLGVAGILLGLKLFHL